MHENDLRGGSKWKNNDVFRYEGVVINPQPDQEGNKLQRPNSGFIQHTPHEAQYAFLARSSNFCKPLKKNQKVVRPTRFFFLPPALGTGGSPTGPDTENGWVIKTLEAQVRQFLLGCTCPVSRGIVVQEKDPLGDLPAEFFLQNVQLHQQS